MSIRPDFTPDQLRHLKSFGLCDVQIVELRTALIEVRRVLLKPAARNDIRKVLKDVEKFSRRLTDTLGAIAAPSNAACAEALGLIEEGYWQGDRLFDDGATSMHHLLPRLEALAKAARAGITALPNMPVRHASADPRPVKRINIALRHGWTKAHGSWVRSTRDPESFDSAFAEAKANPSPKPYPDDFLPSRATDSKFSQIVGICYEAVGGIPEQDRAIRNYLVMEQEWRDKTRAAFEKGLKGAMRKRK